MEDWEEVEEVGWMVGDWVGDEGLTVRVMGVV